MVRCMFGCFWCMVIMCLVFFSVFFSLSLSRCVVGWVSVVLVMWDVLFRFRVIMVGIGCNWGR